MMLRLDFAGSDEAGGRTVRVAAAAAPGVAIIAEAGPRLPFHDSSVDEIFLGRAIAYRGDVFESLDELWRVCKAGALIHLTLPHASSALAVSRDPRPRPLLTLNTFNFYDPKLKPADARTAAAFTVERAALHVAGQRGDDAGMALARGRFARFVESRANSSRGNQYRFERWFSGLFGGFEEFDVVLGVLKTPERRAVSMMAAAASANPASVGSGAFGGASESR